MDTIEGEWHIAIKSLHLLTICHTSFPNTLFQVSTFVLRLFPLVTACVDACVRAHSCHAHEQAAQ